MHIKQYLNCLYYESGLKCVTMYTMRYLMTIVLYFSRYCIIRVETQLR